MNVMKDFIWLIQLDQPQVEPKAASTTMD
jgi:hypothetical protein